MSKINGVAIARAKQWKGLGTHCKYGHLRTPETTGVNRYGFIVCLLCRKTRPSQKSCQIITH